jgi:HSP20 family protein
MSQIAKFNAFPALRSMLDNFWGNDLMEDDFFKRNKIPPVNVKETEKYYEIEVAVPGMKKDDFNIDVDNGILTISAEKKDEKEKVQDNYTRREFSYSAFNRSFSLPQNADEDNIIAKYEDGVLKLSLNKLKEEKSQKKTISLS